MSTVPLESDSPTLCPSGADEHVHVVMCDGLPELYIGQRHLPVGACLQLHREGVWHPARVTLTSALGVAVEVLSHQWPGAPCTFAPEDIELVAARPCID